MSELRTLLTSTSRKFRTLKRQLIFEWCEILIYALGSTVFHFRVILYSPYRFAMKKINLPRNEKVGNELKRPLERWKRVKEDERHFFFFFLLRSTLRLIAEEVCVYFRRNFNLLSSCKNVRSNYRMARNFSEGHPLSNWKFQVNKSIALSAIKGNELPYRQFCTSETRQINATEIVKKIPELNRYICGVKNKIK